MTSINGLTLPASLLADISAGCVQLSAPEIAALAARLVHLRSPRPELCTYEWMERENRFWSAPEVEFYLGAPSPIHAPGDIDPTKAVLFGFAEYDSPIVLDYRTDPPRVVYLGDFENKSYWFELAPSYDDFIASLGRPAGSP